MFKYRYLARMGLQLSDALRPQQGENEDGSAPKILMGTVTGGRINSKILSTNLNWISVRVDGTFDLNLRCDLQLDSGPIVNLNCQGLLYLTPQQWSELAEEDSAAIVCTSDCYFRTTSSFKTADTNLRWLNNIVSVGTGEVGHRRLELDLFELI